MTQIGLWITALLTGAVGSANLLSAVTPSFSDRLDWLGQFFLFEVRAGAHLFAVLSGFWLLILAVNLLRRKHITWLLRIGLPIISILYKRLTRLAPILLSLLLFGVSLWAITQELRKNNPQDVVNSLMAIPKPHLILAIALTLVSYILFTGYDALAIYHLRQSLPYRRTALVAIVSYAISNSVGFALLSGSAIRYRFYSAWGFSAAKIAQIIAFCNLSFWLGFFAVGGVIFTLQPIATPELLNIPFESVRPIGYIFLGIVAAYLLWSGLSQKPLKIKKLVFPHLPVKLSLIQIALTSLDWMLAAAVLYVLLPVPRHLSYFSFFGIYLLGQLAGILSNVPGGLGVFETVLVLLLAPVISADQLLGALLAYRGVYYFLPLGISLLMLGLYELKRQSTRLLS